MHTSGRSILLFAAFAALLLAACAKEISHTESDKPGLFGGETHKETTVYRNPDGSISTEHTEQTNKP